ncbi:LPD38 domain-containing protein [Aquamicrobium sp.]|uniref:LPD38 domain-containing protein n=1 Tax=Aquamicrobium sp. TaxID=1872579 RepID=UPI00258F2939|nr:LPD38 domain-containing protein [Aquamicrobium sp.]MCK9549143.1 hypothetical protein [Aquamicrobium sp.]
MDDQLLNDLRSLGEEPEAVDPGLTGLLPQQEEPVGTSNTAREVAPLIDRLAEQRRREREREEQEAELRSRDGALDALMDPQQYVEGVKGIIPGAIRSGGLVLQAPDVFASRAQHNAARFGRQQIELMDRIDRGEDVSEVDDAMGYRQMSPAQRLQAREQLTKAQRSFAPTPIQERSLFRAGEDVQEFAKGVAPAAPGYEESVGRQLGEGLGSMAVGLPASFIGPMPAAVVFGAMGVGEAADRAVQWDRKEREAGRPGLTQDQIALAGILGTAPGATDMLPLEVMVGRLPIPMPKWMRGAVARGIGRIGGQAFIEGVQEGGQAFLQNLIAREVYDSNQPLVDGLGSEAAIGGGVGAIAQTAKELGSWIIRSAAGRRTRSTEPSRRDEPTPETPRDSVVDLDQFADPIEEEGERPVDEAPLGPLAPDVRGQQGEEGELAASMVQDRLSDEARDYLNEAYSTIGLEPETDLSTVPASELRQIASYLREVQQDIRTESGRYTPGRDELNPPDPAITELLRGINAELRRDAAAQRRQPQLPLDETAAEAAPTEQAAPQSVPQTQSRGRLGTRLEDLAQRDFRAAEAVDSVRGAGARPDVSSEGFSSPTFDQISSVLPPDANGDPDFGRLNARMQAEFGKTGWNNLTPDEKVQLYRTFGGEPAPATQEAPESVTEAGVSPEVVPPAKTAEAAPEPTVGQESAISDDTRQAFREILAGKAPRRQWAEQLGVDEGQLQSLIDEAASEGLVRVDRNGVVRRTARAKVAATAAQPTPRPTQAPRPAAPAQARPSLTIPSDIRLRNSIDARERITGKPLNAIVLDYAGRIEEARGTDAFDGIMAEIRADRLFLKADAHDLAALAGYPVTKSATKKAALETVEKRHRDLAEGLNQKLLPDLAALSMSQAPPQVSRTFWGGFPSVETLLPRHALRNHNPELYDKAKAGDHAAAAQLVDEVVRDEAIERLRATIGDRQPVIVAVMAEEASGRNAIPRTFAKIIGRHLGLPVDSSIVQTVRAQHTGADAFARLARQPVFSGPVVAGQDYVIVDDTVTMGGTLANLRGYIESQGGRVILASTLTGGPQQNIVPSAAQLDAVRKKHPDLDEWWQNEFGFPLETLTASELGHLRKAVSLDAIRDRISAARGSEDRQGGGRVLPQEGGGEVAPSTSTGDTEPPSGGFSLASLTGLPRLPTEPSAPIDALIITAIERKIDAMLPADVATRIKDRITHPSGAVLNAQFLIGKRMVELGLVNSPLKIFHLGKHEVIHALRMSGLFTQDEWQRLVSHAKKINIDEQITAKDANGKQVPAIPGYRNLYRTSFSGIGLRGKELNEVIEELIDQERVAKMAEQWVAREAKFGRAIDQILDRISRFIEAAARALNNLGIRSLDDYVELANERDVQRIAERVLSGEVGGRARPDDLGLPIGVQQLIGAVPRSDVGQIVPAASQEGRAVLDALLAIRAFHGSPHDFDRFSMEKIGTGEGAQAFGHGLYFAEAENVAKDYQSKLAPPQVNTGYRNIDTELSNVHGGDWEAFKAAHPNPSPGLKEAIEDIESRGATGSQQKGRFYEVRINAEPEDFLDWDVPIAEQSEKVRAALRSIGHPDNIKTEEDLAQLWQRNVRLANGRILAWYFSPPLSSPRFGSEARVYESGGKWTASLDMPGGGLRDFATEAEAKQWADGILRRNFGSGDLGSDVARQLTARVWLWNRKITDPRKISRALRKAGIKGIRYLDGFSRHKGEGHHNYVVFDDSLIEITAKDGKPVSSQEKQDFVAASLASVPSQPQPRSFNIEGFSGTVSTSEDENGNRVRTYRVSEEDVGSFERREPADAGSVNVPSSVGFAVLKEQDDGTWSASMVRIEPGHRRQGVPSRLLRAIEEDLGQRLAPQGWLTAEQYAELAESNPDAVRFHQPAGPAFDDMWVSPKQMEFGAEILKEFASQAPDAASAREALDQARQLEAMRALVPAEAFEQEQAMFALRGLPHPINLGTPSRSGTEAPEKSLSDLVSDLTDALGLTVRHGRLSPGLKAAAGRLGMSVAGQFSRATGVTRIAIPNDLATLAHEGGHALETRNSTRDDVRQLQDDHIEELITAPSRNFSPPQMPASGFSGVELDDDTQRVLIDAVQADVNLRAQTLQAGQAKSGVRFMRGKIDDAAYKQAQREAGMLRAVLIRRLGQRVADAVLDDVKKAAPRDLQQYIAQRFSATGTPKPRPAPPQASRTELSEGWAEFFRQYVTNPREARIQAPRLYEAFEDMLDGAEPDMLEQLQEIQKGFTELKNASPAGAVMSRVQSSVKPSMFAQFRKDLAEKGPRATISDKLYGFYHAAVDGRHPMKRAVKFLMELGADNLGVQLGDNERMVLKAADDPYKVWRLAEHSKVWATATLQNGVRLKGEAEPSGPSFHEALSEAFGGTAKGQWNDEKAQTFGSYLVARRMLAEWKRYENGELENPPDSLIEKRVWQKARQDIEKAHPEFAKAAQLLYGFNKRHLQNKFLNGFLTEDLFLELNAREDYVPLNRMMDDDGPSALTKPRGQNKRKLIYRFKGSTRDFINPLESIAQDVYATQARFALNDVIGAMDRLSRAVGPGGGVIAERIPPNDMRGTRVDIREAMRQAARDLDPNDAQGLIEMIDDLFDQDAAATIFRAVPTEEKGEPIVYLWEEGKRVPIRLGDNRIARDIFETMVALGRDNSDIVTDIFSYGAQAFRFGVTKATSYIAVNFIRDQVATWILSRDYVPLVSGAKGLWGINRGGTIGAVTGAALGTGVGVATGGIGFAAIPIGTIFGMSLGSRLIGKHAKDLARYNAFAGLAGVESGLIDSPSTDRDILALRRTGFLGVPSRGRFIGTWQRILRAAEVTEAASRLGHFKAAYDRALKDGFTPEEAAIEAAYAAHDVLDFSRKGAKMGQVARIMAFTNSALQGLDAAFRTATGERNIYRNYREALTPFIKSANGSPLSIAEKEALPNSVRMWIKMVAIGLMGVALFALDDDDETNDYMRATHWFFNLFGIRVRIPKPFELGIFSNIFESAFAYWWRQDERAHIRFLESLRHTVVPPAEIQALYSLGHIAAIPSVIWEHLVAQDPFKKPFDSDIPQHLRALPPELQFNAYTSEFSKLLGNVMGWSPAQIDNFIANTFATLGREFLTGSDYALPRINQLVGGRLPGVSVSPRAEKPIEDYWFISRFTRRQSRGALSTQYFWQQMSMDGGKYVQAANGYRELLRAGNEVGAKDLLDGLDQERRAYALLEGHFKEKDQDIHPMNRARQVIGAMSGIRREMVLDRLVKQSTANKKHTEPEKIALEPSKQKIVNEILEDIAMREARNALVVVQHPGWKNKSILPTDGLLAELRAAVPEVADELDYRLNKGRYKVYPFEGVRRAWPKARDVLLKEGQDAILAEFRTEARFP